MAFKRELKRQGVHLFFMLLLWLLAVSLGQRAFIIICLGLLALGWFLLSTDNKVSSWLIGHLERPAIRRFAPGKGAITVVLGALITAILFYDQLSPALLVLGISDSLATLVGVTWGRRKVPLFPSKTWAGTLAFSLSAAFILSFFTWWWHIAALIVTLAELIDYQQQRFLDDNAVLPVITGLLLTVL